MDANGREWRRGSRRWHVGRGSKPMGKMPGPLWRRRWLLGGGGLHCFEDPGGALAGHEGGDGVAGFEGF